MCTAPLLLTSEFTFVSPAGLFVSLYSAVERLVMYQDQGSKAASRCILLHEFCPALHSLLEDGLKVGTFIYNTIIITVILNY